MEKNKDIERLKKEYEAIAIPEALEHRIEEAIEASKKVIALKVIHHTSVAVAAFCGLFVVSINVSPVFAQSLAEVPLVGGIVKVLTLKEYHIAEKDSVADIKIPQVEGLKDKALEQALNEELAKEGEASYQSFIKQIEELEGIEGATARLAMDVRYETLTDNESVFALKLTKTEIMASANVQTKYYVIDKTNHEKVELKKLFINDDYLSAISKELTEQMKEQMKVDPNKIYWVKEDDFARFEGIKADQKFYINAEGKLVICFDKYEVSPGFMGTSEFVIPTEVIEGLLVNKELIK